MVVTNDEALAAKVRLLRGQGMDPNRRYWFPHIGYNYRMTNIAAAIGLAQFERVQWHLQRRREVAAWYREHLASVSGITWQMEQGWAKHSYWMFNIILSEDILLGRDEVMTGLAEAGIETRPVFYPMHQLPPYQECIGGAIFPVADRISRRGITLPTWAGLTPESVGEICDTLRRILHRGRTDRACR